MKRGGAVGFATLKWAQKEQITEYEEETGRRKEVSANKKINVNKAIFKEKKVQ